MQGRRICKQPKTKNEKFYKMEVIMQMEVENT